MTVWNALAYFNIAAGVLLFALHFRFYLRCRASYRVIKLLIGVFIGLYWAGLYLMIAILPLEATHSTTFALYYVRTGVTGTLLVLLMAAIFRDRVGGKDERN